MQIQTSRDIFTTITLRTPEVNNAQSLTVKYRISQRNILTGKDLPSTEDSVRVIDRAEQTTPVLDENGEPTGETTVIPAVTDFTDLMASATTPTEFWDAMLQKAIEHADLTEWDETVIEDAENDPNISDVRLWIEVVASAPPANFLVKGNRVEHLGVWYDVENPHTAIAAYPPPIASLYALSAEQPGDTPDGPNFTPWEAQTYALDAYTTHSDKYWKNRRDNNNQQFAPGITGSGWMEVNAQGEPIGEWYNLGNEGYPQGYIALGPPCWINNVANNTFGPGVANWSNTECP